MAPWRSTHNSRPQSPQALVRVKGIYNGGSAGEQPFQGYAQWLAPEWTNEDGRPFSSGAYQITHWKEDEPGDVFYRYTIAGLGLRNADRPPMRADFSWDENGKHHTKWFSEQELAQEMKRRETGGIEVPPEFSEALDWLRDPNRPRAAWPDQGITPKESTD